jgi:benzodiazapine receptor
MQRDTLRQVVTIIGLVATLIVNALANILPLNGLRSGDVTAQYPVLFVPAPYVFAIWGVIYSGLIAFAIFQALPSQRENPRLRRIGGLFAVASLANIAWIFAWHCQNFPLSMLFMLILLGSLIGIYLRLGTGRTRVTRAETWAVRVPFSIYLGWITVATIANASQLLYVLGWGGWGLAPVTWTIIMLAAAVVVAALVAVTRRDVAYLAVLVWAVIGIALRQTSTPAVSLAAWVATGIVALLLLWSAVRPLRLPESAANSMPAA